MDPVTTSEQQTLLAENIHFMSMSATECSYAGTTVLDIQELLEEVLQYLPPGALLRLQRVCKNWQYTIGKYAHFKRSLFLVPIEGTEVWDINRRAAHGRLHRGREQVVLGRRRGKDLAPPRKLPVPCKTCGMRGIPRPMKHTESVLVPIQFNPLFCDQRPEDKADSLDERASRPACADLYLREWDLRYEESQSRPRADLTSSCVAGRRSLSLGITCSSHSQHVAEFEYRSPATTKEALVVSQQQLMTSWSRIHLACALGRSWRT